jgi:hypothetical protein
MLGLDSLRYSVISIVHFVQSLMVVLIILETKA